MAGKNGYTAQQFIDVIPGSGGIVSTIAKRVGCDWQTASKYLTTFPTVNQVYQAEKETLKDMAEGILITNIRLTKEAQEETKERQDASDAKWYLSKMAKDRGYVDRQELEHSGSVKQTLVILPPQDD